MVEKLVFKKIWILSKAEKKAISLKLGPKMNFLTGENDVGKSTIMKSFYHCLGADTPQINNSQWKKANPIYCINVEISGTSYYIIRDEKYFGVFDEGRKLVSRHSSVTGKNGIVRFINKKLNFNIELERQANSKLGLAGPAFYFLPFYIDQDEGWTASWSSFLGLQQFRSYRKLMIEYHLGVRSQQYYDAKKRDIELHEKLALVENQRVSMQAARESMRKRKQKLQVDIDPNTFRSDIEEIVDAYNSIYAEQQDVLLKLKDIRSQRNAIDTEKKLLRRAISELEADYLYAESVDTPDIIGCPTCGTEFENSVVERFGILDDVDHCYALLDQWQKRRNDISDQLQGVEREYDEVSQNLKNVQAILSRTKQNITLSELIASEGLKEIMASLNNDINLMLDDEKSIHKTITENSEGLKIDSKKKREIVEYYKARMKEFLNALNVGVLSEDDYKTLDKQIKNNALGSDLSRSLLAQCFAFLQTMKAFNNFVLCPLLIDSPFQQEQDPINKSAIFDFILSKRLDDQQTIIATISVSEFKESPALQSAMSHTVDGGKLSLLKASEYETVLSEIGEMHRLTLEE